MPPGPRCLGNPLPGACGLFRLGCSVSYGFSCASTAAADGVRGGERAPAAVWVGRVSARTLGGASQARFGAPRQPAPTEVVPCGRRASGGLLPHARGWPQRTEPDRHLPLLGEPRTVRPPETPRSPAKLNCPALGAPGPAGAPGAGCGRLVMDDRETTWLGRVPFCPRV